MVLEQVALLGVAGVDAYLVSAYLNAKRQAEARANALSYQPRHRPVPCAPNVEPVAAAPAGSSAVLSDRLAAIKSAVGQTKFADEVLPYELGALPSTSIEETQEETVSESTTVIETGTRESTDSSTTSVEATGAISERVDSHDRRIQDLSSEFAVLEYRIAEVERMLGVEKQAEKKSEQIEIPFKPVIVQPVVVEKKVATAKKHAKKKRAAKKAAKARKKAAKKNVNKVAKKSAKRVSRKVAKNAIKTSVTVTAKKAAPKKAARKNARSHKRSKARRQTQRVEVVIKNQAAKKRKAKPRKPRRAKKGRVEVVFKAAKGTVVKKTAKSGSNRVEITVAGKKGPARKAKAKKKAAAKTRRAKASRSSNKVEVVVKTASGKKVAVKKKHATKKAANRVEVVLKEPSQKIEVVPVQKEQKPSEKKDSAADSKDHMDIEWKGSTIKLYSGESKD